MRVQIDPTVTDHIAQHGVTRCPTMKTYDQLEIAGLEVGNEDLLGLPPGLVSDEFTQSRRHKGAANGRSRANGWRSGVFVFGKRAK